jgi:hypothetical protein
VRDLTGDQIIDSKKKVESRSQKNIFRGTRPVIGDVKNASINKGENLVRYPDAEIQVHVLNATGVERQGTFAS